MGIWGTGLKIASELSVSQAGGGQITLDVGHAIQAAVGGTDGAAVQAAIGAVTDITNPAGTGGWTTMFSASGSKLLVMVEDQSVLSAGIIASQIGSTEDAGDALRTQVLVDGEVVVDFTITADAISDVGEIVNSLGPSTAGGDNIAIFECGDSFTIKMARKGGLSGASTKFGIGKITYWKLVD